LTVAPELDYLCRFVEHAGMGRKKGSISTPRNIPAEGLREILKPIFNKLRKARVPEAQFPSNETLVSKLLDWIDDSKVDKFVTEYAKLMKR
jgi:hypothetical protein